MPPPFTVGGGGGGGGWGKGGGEYSFNAVSTYICPYILFVCPVHTYEKMVSVQYLLKRLMYLVHSLYTGI